jgi:transmembrane sensor
MSAHSKFTRIEDLVTNPRFIRWVLEDKAEDQVFWEDWLRQHPDRLSLVEEARTLLRSLSIRETELSPAEIRERIENIVKKARQPAGRVVFWRPLLRWSAAAVLLGLLGIGLFLHNSSDQNKAPASADLPGVTDSLMEAVNTGPGEKVVRLDDGSSVTLFPRSIIRYAPHTGPGSPMDIYLSGEALFSVAEHANRPFRVYAHELVTQVLGTRFRVSARGGARDIRVTVLSGKVSVSRAGEVDSARVLAGVVLTPNQELIYGRDQRIFRKLLVDTPVIIRTPVVRPDFHYDNVPVSDVLEELKTTFAIDIVYDKETLKHCRISADLSDESIYKKLDLICQAMDAHYEVIDGVVTIQAKPCR